MALASQLWHRLRANLHGLCGRAWFRLRRPQRARLHFEQVLRLLGDDFAAHLYLGRIAFAGGDYAGWRRELRSAYRADPLRFTQLAQSGSRGAGLGLGDETGPQLAGTGVEPHPRQGVGGTGPTGRGEGESKPLQDGPTGTASFGAHPDPETQGDEATKRRRAGTGKNPDAESGSLPIRQTPERRPPDERIADVLRAMLAAAGASDLEDDCTSDQERNRFANLGPIAADEVRACDLDDLTRRFGA